MTEEIAVALPRVAGFRYSQWEFGRKKWESYPWGSDTQIIRGEVGEKRKGTGPMLAGVGRSLRLLTNEQYSRLVEMLDVGTDRLSPDEENEIYSLLDQCPFTTYVPPWDIDVADDATPEDAELARSYALKITEWLTKNGFSEPTWCRTNLRGGLHGDQTVAREIESRKLVKTFATLAKTMAKELDIPLTSNYRAIEGRPKVVLDDTLFNKKPSGRAGVWRLVGSRKNETSYPKTPCFILEPGCPEISTYYNPKPHPKATVEQWLARETDPPFYDALSVRAAKDSRTERLPLVIPDLALENVSRVSQALVAGIGARHEFRLRMAGWLLTSRIPEGVVAKTVSTISNQQDGIEAARSTWSAYKAGMPIKKLRGWRDIPQEAHEQLIKALESDLTALGLKQPGDARDATTSFRDRTLLAQASLKAKGKQATSLSRASQCGMFCDVIACTGKNGCGKIHSKRPLMCGRRNSSCPYCMKVYTKILAEFWAEEWPERMAICHVTLKDKSAATAKRVAQWFGTVLKGKGSYIIGPGHVLFMTGHISNAQVMACWNGLSKIPSAAKNFLNLDVVVERMGTTSRGEAMQRALVVRRSLEVHLRNLLDEGDAEKLGNDEWGEKVRCFVPGRQTLIKSPDDDQRKALTKKAAEERRKAREAMNPTNEQEEVCCSRMDLELRRELRFGTDEKTWELVHAAPLRWRQFPWSLGAARKEYAAVRKRVVFDQG